MTSSTCRGDQSSLSQVVCMFACVQTTSLLKAFPLKFPCVDEHKAGLMGRGWKPGSTGKTLILPVLWTLENICCPKMEESESQALCDSTELNTDENKRVHYDLLIAE